MRTAIPRKAPKRAIANSTPTSALLQYVLLDVGASGLRSAQVKELEKMGLHVVDTPLVSPESAPYLDDVLLTESLLSLA